MLSIAEQGSAKAFLRSWQVKEALLVEGLLMLEKVVSDEARLHSVSLDFA